VGEQIDLAARLRVAEAKAAAQGIDISTHRNAIERRVRVMQERIYGRPVLPED
jgi:hypothetical protein